MIKPKKYLTNKELLGALERWRETDDPVMTDEVTVMLLKLVNKYIGHPNYASYPWQQKQDMMSEALIHMIKYGKRFDPEKSNNPFAYFTQIAKNAFIQIITKEYRNQARSISMYLENTDNIVTSDTYNELLVETLEANRKSRESNKQKQKSKKPRASLFDMYDKEDLANE